MELTCPKHPKYKGKRPPKNICPVCFKIWALLAGRQRVGVKPTKIMKDRTKYSRKAKHKTGQE
jgi:hypothetical protein